jgi:PilZ domain
MEPRNKRPNRTARWMTGVLLEGKMSPGGKDFDLRTSVTYSVIEPASKRLRRGDKRFAERRRTRLRTGKITDLMNRFIVECQLHDRSTSGARIRLMAHFRLPLWVRFYDDELRTIDTAEVMWRDKLEIGLRFMPKEPLSRSDRAAITALGGKCYALGL